MKDVHETEKLRNVNDSRNLLGLSPHLFLYLSRIKNWKHFIRRSFAVISQRSPTYFIPHPLYTHKPWCAQFFSLSPSGGLPNPYCLLFKTSILISPQDRSWHAELMNGREGREGSARMDVQSLTNWPQVFLRVRFVSLWENDDEIAIRSADKPQTMEWCQRWHLRGV